MGNLTRDKLVSLILEEIQQGHLAPNKPVFLSNWGDVVRYFNIGIGGAGHETEMGEMANIKKIPRKLGEPLRINVNELNQSQSSHLPKIVSMDPDSDQLVENVIIGDEVIDMPNGVEVLKFYNYGEGEKLDRSNRVAAYVVLPENIFYKHPPRNVKMGTHYVPKNLTLTPEGESDKNREARLAKIKAENEGYAKKYVIFPVINKFFSARQILDRLDTSLIPETWASTLRTERVTNKELRMLFGGNGSNIEFEIYAVRDIDNIEAALDEVLKTRMDIEDGVENRERKRSETKPREYANYIYTRGGNWVLIQRIFDKNAFKNAGEYTKILKLLKQNIQKGEKGFNVFSKLSIKGATNGPEEYLAEATFTATVNYRTVEAPVEGGQIINPIRVPISKEIPEEVSNGGDFSARTQPGFYRELLQELLVKLGQEMIAKINPDEVLNKITDFLIPTNVNKEFLNPEQ